jgi:thiamine pyrophosphate-dependent acetolactate synthase large subunit-like protein
MNPNPTCGEALVRLLESYGVDTVFGVPGVHTLELYRGLATSGIRHVLPRHEQGAGFMADGYARLSGRPGVCFVITGPGVTNAATSLGQAYSDSVPLLLISSVNSTRTLGKGWGELHEIRDQRGLTRPLTAFSATALSPGDVPDLLARAFAVFASARPRPVHIEIPTDVLAASVRQRWTPRAVPSRAVPEESRTAEAAALLAKAERPIILVGGGALSARDAIIAIAERLDAPVITSLAAKGLIPDTHPLSAGSTLWLAATQACLAAADVVLALGSELAATDSLAKSLVIPGKLIRVDIDPGKLVDRQPAEIAILADAAATAEAIATGLASGHASGWNGTAKARVAQARRANLDAATPLQRVHLKVLETLRAALPEPAVVTADMTHLAYTGNCFFSTEQPRGWIYPAGYGTLGFALPAAIGAKLAAPERPVVALAGDAGVLYTAQELATAAELGLPLLVVLWNNQALGQIRDDMIAKGIPELGVIQKNPDFLMLARAFGCHAARPETLEALGPELAAGLGRDGPSVIEVRHDLKGLC